MAAGTNQGNKPTSVEPGSPADIKVAAAPEADRPPMKDLKGVKYSGTANIRRVSTADLKRLGVEDPQTDLEWNQSNGFVVPITDVNADTVDALIKLPGFSAV